MAIKVLFHLNQVGYGGTEKAILSFCQNLDREKFEPYLFIYNSDSRLKHLRYCLLSFLSQKHKIRYQRRYIESRARIPDFLETLGEENIFEGSTSLFKKVMSYLSPDIVHFNRGKWERYFDTLINIAAGKAVCVETNIFGYPASDNYFNRLAKAYFVSNWLLEKSPWSGDKGAVLYNPIKKPANNESIRHRLEIPDDAFIFGRISRPDLADDDFILGIFDQVHHGNTYLLIFAGSEIMRNAAKDNEHIKLIDATTDENVISRFYNSIDLLLHYRIDGETFGMNIAEAMIHGKPVISHLSHVDNAQAELLASTAEHGTVGYVVAENDMPDYVKHIKELMNNQVQLKVLGTNARKRAKQLFQEDVVCHFLEDEYKKLLITT